MTKDIQADPLHSTVDVSRLAEHIASRFQSTALKIFASGMNAKEVFESPSDLTLMNKGLTKQSITDFNQAYQSVKSQQQIEGPHRDLVSDRHFSDGD
jgi:hypothetical protein